jgi:hypothetical protein
MGKHEERDGGVLFLYRGSERNEVTIHYRAVGNDASFAGTFAM